MGAAFGGSITSPHSWSPCSTSRCMNMYRNISWHTLFTLYSVYPVYPKYVGTLYTLNMSRNISLHTLYTLCMYTVQVHIPHLTRLKTGHTEKKRNMTAAWTFWKQPLLQIIIFGQLGLTPSARGRKSVMQALTTHCDDDDVMKGSLTKPRLTLYALDKTKFWQKRGIFAHRHWLFPNPDAADQETCCTLPGFFRNM